MPKSFNACTPAGVASKKCPTGERRQLVSQHGHSPERSFPRQWGAGCSFFLRNDGWMVSIVNSGASVSLRPQYRSKRPYRRNRDERYQRATRPGWLRRSALDVRCRYDGDGPCICSPNYGRTFLPQQRNGLLPHDGKSGVCSRWSTCVTCLITTDGKLDLFVSSFVFYDSRRTALHRHNLEAAFTAFRPFHHSRHIFLHKGAVLLRLESESVSLTFPASHSALATDVNTRTDVSVVGQHTMPNFLFLTKMRKFAEVGLVTV